MKEQRPHFLGILSAIAIRWLRRGADEEKKELISTKKFILKAERKYIHNPLTGTEIESTFSVHRVIDGQWRYEKYIVNSDNHFNHLRSGVYPYAWE